MTAARVHSLGYLVVETTDLDRWRELAVDVLGMAVGNGPAPDCEIARAEAHKTELDGMLDTLSPREFVDTVASTWSSMSG